MAEREQKISRAERELTAKLVREVRQAARAVTSLDRPIGDENDGVLGDLFAAEGAQPDEEVQVSLRQEALHAAMKRLPDREREVLQLRYGLDGDPEPKS